MDSSPFSNESEDGSGIADPDKVQDKAESSGNEYEAMENADEHTEVVSVGPGTVFSISFKQPRSNWQHKMRFPELCRNFGAVAWCGKLNAIACASETCARILGSKFSPPFWIPVHILIPERPTECAVFNVIADSPRDSVQFMEWSPISCPRALLIANVHGRVTIWTQPSQGSPNAVRDASLWHCEHEWRQDVAVVTKWLCGMSPYRWLSSNPRSSGNAKSTFEEIFLAPQPQQTPESWPNFLCVCSVFASGSLQLHWSHWPPVPDSSLPKWFWTSKGLLGAGPSGIRSADAIITETGALHIVGVPVVNPSTVVIWEVAPGSGNTFQSNPKLTISNRLPPLNSWEGFSPLAAYLFSWQEFLLSEAEKINNCDGLACRCDTITLHCSPVSNFSAYVSPETAALSEAATTWGSGVTAVAFDPTCGGSVVAIVIAEGQYMSPYDPDKGPTITGWRIQRWESSVQSVVLHPIFRNSSASIDEEMPLQTVWERKIELTIAASDDFRDHSAAAGQNSETGSPTTSVIERVKMVSYLPSILQSDVKSLTRIIYSAHGGEVAIAFLGGSVHVFSGSSFTPVDNYLIDVGTAIATPAFSPTSCCSASVWHDTCRDCTVLRIIRVLPFCQNSELKANSVNLECEIAERFWWSLLVGVDWWDAVGFTQSASEDNIVSLNSVIAILDADFHALPSTQHRQQYGPYLDRIKCRLLEGIQAQEVRALVLDMQARMLLDMLGKGIECSLINPSSLISEPWQASGETLSAIDPESMAVDPSLVLSIQTYVDTVLDLASHFITRLRRYASFCRTLATHAASASTGSNRSAITALTPNSGAGTVQGQSGTSSTGNMQMQAWVQGAIAKINSTADGASSTVNPMSGSSSFMPISINTGTFPGTPAVRLIGDCHFLHRLCQLLLFSFFFRRTQFPRFGGISQRPSEAMTRPPSNSAIRAEETSGISARPTSTLRTEEVQGARSGYPGAGAKGAEDGPGARSRLGSGNAGQGYTFDEVKVLFLILVDLCRRTAGLAHPLPTSQVGNSNIHVRLHYIDGNYTVLPEVVEASLGPHMQNMPRPRGADAAGLLLRELELHPPSEEWHKRNMYGGPWSNPQDTGSLDEMLDSDTGRNGDACELGELWPRKRRMSERDAAFGTTHLAGLGRYLGVMGSRRDVVAASWKTGLEGVWYKCIRCLRQTASAELAIQNEREMWWSSRWVCSCPMCGGAWVRMV